ncbi:hypothetical protein EUZ69_12885 [Enterococcus faecalis]|uniref:hypothetical protein n=1 Tax=Enterococcus faecalis TaxID=1351 RepID=UPI0013D3FA82|nr:hypothetical protein [Enterococcus faecalis]NFA64839.1 hypothetical protein [Enterococcus faecalis]NFA95270.1 hypothetical protein [Enterococcus faecalis]
MKITFNYIFSHISFWKQIVVWLISIVISTKVIDLFTKQNGLLYTLAKLVVGFLLGLLMLYIIAKRKHSF